MSRIHNKIDPYLIKNGIKNSTCSILFFTITQMINRNRFKTNPLNVLINYSQFPILTIVQHIKRTLINTFSNQLSISQYCWVNIEIGIFRKCVKWWGFHCRQKEQAFVSMMTQMMMATRPPVYLGRFPLHADVSFINIVLIDSVAVSMPIEMTLSLFTFLLETIK